MNSKILDSEIYQNQLNFFKMHRNSLNLEFYNRNTLKITK